MTTATLRLMLGLVCLLVGGAFLILIQNAGGAAVGTVFGLAGLALIGWTLFRGKDEGGRMKDDEKG